VKTKEEVDEPLMSWWWKKKESVVDEDWRGSCWWRVKTKEDPVDDGKKEREAKNCWWRVEDWTLKSEEKTVDAGEKRRSLPLLIKSEDWRGCRWWWKKNRERQIVVDEVSKTELWSLKRKLLSVDYGEKTRSLPTAAVDEDWRGSREPSILKILSSEIRNLG
jgi:hypothetical protein